MGKHVEWRKLNDYPSFEINRLGDLRQVKTKLRMDPGFIDKFYSGFAIRDDINKAKRDLINSTFPEFKR